MKTIKKGKKNSDLDKISGKVGGNKPKHQGIEEDEIFDDPMTSEKDEVKNAEEKMRSKKSQ